MKPFLFRDETIFTQTFCGHQTSFQARPINGQRRNLNGASCPNGIANGPHFKKVASEAKSPCQHGVFPSSCIFRRRVDPEAARRDRFHKLGYKPTERASLSPCRTRPTILNRARFSRTAAPKRMLNDPRD